MKKFTKFLGIFLALSMVIGMLSVVGAVDPETPTAPAAPTGAILQGTVLEVVSPTKLETVFGYYEENAIDDPDAFIDCEDGACVTDGWFARAGYSECTLDDGTIGLIMSIDEVTALGGIEIVGKNAANCPTEFTVEALVDGAWVEVLYGNNSFSTGMTQMFTFDTVETDTVRIIVTAVAEEGEQCYFNEVTLFTPKTGNLKTVIDMNGKVTDNDAHNGSGVNNSVDGDKSTFFTGSTITVDLGEATAIDGFNLYHYRNSAFPNNITVSIQKTEGGEFETIGTFATGFSTAAIQDSMYVTFDQTYMAYAVKFASDVWGYQNDYELWQYQREGSAEEPTPAPTEEPTPAPTEEPTPAPTEEPTPAPTEEPTPAPTEAPAPTYTWIDQIPESSLTPHVGYYVGNDYTTLTDECPGEAELLTDARVSSGSWVHGNTFPVPSGKTPAAVVEVGGARIIAGVYVCCKAGQELTDFVVEVLNENGEWVTANTTTGNTATDLKIVFDTAVVGTAVRVIINDWNGDHPMMQELWIYEGLTTNALVQVPVAGVTATQDPVVPHQPIDLVIDGMGFTYYQIGAGNMPVAINFDTTNADGSATNVSRMRIYAFNNSKMAAKDIVVDVRTGEETWETVYTGVAYELNHTDTFVLDFGAEYAAFDVRLTINTVTAENLVLTEVELFGNGEPVAPPTETPTEPTEPSEPVTPTTPSEPEPTVPAEALPEAPVVVPGTTTIAGGVVKEGNIYAMVSPKTITTGFGYYDANGSFVDRQDGYCVTDGWYGRSGYSECTTADGQMALVMTLDEVKNIGRVEIVGRLAEHLPVDFEIQVLVDGEWVTVADVNESPFTTGMTVAYTFPAVATNQVRILINAVSVPTNQCHLNEVELYEVTTGKLYNKINLVGTNIGTDAHESAPVVNLTDGDKAPYFLGANATFNLTDADGNPTSIDAMTLFMYRGNQAFPSSINVMIQKTAGGEFESIGVFATGWTTGYPQDRLFAEFDQTYDAYAIQLNLDAYSYVAEFELFQYEKDEAPEQPPVDPENPTEPSEPTVPSEPTDEPTEPSVPADPTVPSEPADPTVPSEPTDEPSEPTDEPTEPGTDEPGTDEPGTDEPGTDEPGADEPGEDLPEIPELPGLPDITDIEATIDMIYELDPNDYTAESYANLVVVVKEVNKIISGGFNQTMIDRANEMLTEALAALVPVNGGTDAPGGDGVGDGDGDGDGDTDLPAPTGDIALTVLSVLMTMSTVGGAVVIGKKKFF